MAIDPRGADLKRLDGVHARTAPFTVNVFTSRWDLELVAHAYLDVARFDDFQQSLGISRQVLAQRLRALVAEGILMREQYQSRPDRFEYKLTAKGRDLLPVVVAMLRWSERWRPQEARAERTELLGRLAVEAAS
jgi:DNA-binding HxlR family transcriptional regulator